jgi:hypothetical protein
LAALRAQNIPGDQTQVLPGAGRTKPSGDRAQTVPDAGMAELAGDQTQVLPGAGESTQVLPSGGTVERPGDRTQVLSFPPAARPVVPRQAAPRRDSGERTTDRQEPATRAKSIIGEEQPDPAADPTTRLSLLRPPGEQAGEGTTDGNNRRTKSMLDLERPADESADDTRRLVTPPHNPHDDEPTTRL